VDGAQPGAAVARDLRPPVVRNLGVALELRPGDADVLAMAVSLARLHRSRLTLLHVVESPGGMVYGAESGSLHAREDQARLESLAREIEGADLPVEILLRTGKPAPEIVAAVHELGLDMLVMGTHGHKGLGDVVHGETVHGVRHALTIPVVLVRVRSTESNPSTPST
jgi:manganese transport protein